MADLLADVPAIPDDIPLYVACVATGESAEERLPGLRSIRKILSRGEEGSLDLVISGGDFLGLPVMPLLVGMVDDDEQDPALLVSP